MMMNIRIDQLPLLGIDAADFMEKVAAGVFREADFGDGPTGWYVGPFPECEEEWEDDGALRLAHKLYTEKVLNNG